MPGLVVIALTPNLGRAAVITYPNFNNTTGITLNGAASVVNDSGNVIRLAPVSLNKTGSVWFNTRLDLLRGFSTTFTYNIHDGSGADGLAFVLHSDPRGLGAIGGGTEGNQLGASGITNSVAIAIRTFIYNRIEVDACGQNQPQKIGGSDTSGLSPPYCVIGSVYQTSKNSLRGVHSISVDYTPGTLTIKLDGSTILTTAINIANYVNTPDGKVYVGFTGGTGASTDNHDIRSWSFSNLPDLAISKNPYRKLLPGPNQCPIPDRDLEYRRSGHPRGRGYAGQPSALIDACVGNGHRLDLHKFRKLPVHAIRCPLAWSELSRNYPHGERCPRCSRSSLKYCDSERRWRSH
jgi:hypothetical protein